MVEAALGKCDNLSEGDEIKRIINEVGVASEKDVKEYKMDRCDRDMSFNFGSTFKHG